MSVEDTLKLALDALEDSQLSKTNAAIKALEEALANHCEDNLDMVKQEQGESDDLMIAYMSGLHDGKKLAKKEQGEIERLTAALKKANEQAEHFEREWYLRGDELEKLKQERGEPVATVVARQYDDGTHAGNALDWAGRNCENDFPVGTKFYTTPAQLTWVGLTEGDISDAWDECENFQHGMRIIEAKLKEKNQ
jgi:hypothetical protein